MNIPGRLLRNTLENCIIQGICFVKMHKILLFFCTAKVIITKNYQKIQDYILCQSKKLRRLFLTYSKISKQL
jgi:hypothetical protein